MRQCYLHTAGACIITIMLFIPCVSGEPPSTMTFGPQWDSQGIFVGGNRDFLKLKSIEWGNSISVEAWIFVTKLADENAMTNAIQPVIFDFGAGHTQSRITVAFASGESSQVQLCIKNSGAFDASCMQTIDELPLSRWAHLAISIDADQNQGSIFFDGTLRAQAPLTPPDAILRTNHYVGHSVVVGTAFFGIVDDLRLWSIARIADEIEADMLQVLPVGTEGLEQQYLFEENDTNWNILVDSSGNKYNGELHCSSTACRVPVNTTLRVVCGDGVRSGDETCDDGNSLGGDGCNEECQVETGYVCLGGEDFVNTDVCSSGKLLFSEGFNDGNADAWMWRQNTGPRSMGSWSVGPMYKSAGEYGMQMCVFDQTFDGCPEFIKNGIFRDQEDDPIARSGSVALETWQSSRGSEPGGSSYVLRMGTTTSHSSTDLFYTVGRRRSDDSSLQNIFDEQLWPPGTERASYRASFWVYVEGDINGSPTIQCGQDIISVTLSSGGSSSTTVGEGTLPTVANVWRWVFVDVSTTSKPDDISISVLASNHINGRMWVTGLSVIRKCPGLPQGPSMWLKGDGGLPQINDAQIDKWEDSSSANIFGYATGSSRPSVRTDYNPTRHSAGSMNRECDQHAQDVGYPSLVFGHSDGMLFNQQEIPIRRPMTICIVDRFTPGGSRSGRILQDRYDSWIIGSNHGDRGVYIDGGGWVGRIDKDSFPNPKLAYNLWGLVCSVLNRENSTAWYNGEFLGEFIRGSHAFGPQNLALGDAGYTTNNPNAEVAEILLYRRSLSDEELYNVQISLAHKWGIQLHASHPKSWIRMGYEPNIGVASNDPTIDSTAQLCTLVSRVSDLLASSDSTSVALSSIEPSIDFIYAETMREKLPDLASRFLFWGRRTISDAISGSTHIALSVNIRTPPYYAGIPLWVVLGDASVSSDPISSPCYTKNSQCPTDAKFIRICFNVARSSSFCDIVAEIENRIWRRQLWRIEALFQEKYGIDTTVPTHAWIAIGTLSPFQPSAVWVDEISVYDIATSTDSASCTSVDTRAYTGGGKIVNLDAMTSSDIEITSQSGNINVGVSSSSLLFSGSVAPSSNSDVDTTGYVIDPAGHASATYKYDFAADYDVRMDIAIGSNTDTDSDSTPSLTFCDGEVRLAYDNQADKWRYIHRTETLQALPSDYAQFRPDGTSIEFNNNLETYWEDYRVTQWRYRVTYSFWLNPRGTTNNYEGIFFRGGNVTWYQDDGLKVYSSRDRNPAVYQRPYDTRLHIRKATNVRYNNGCDPTQNLPINAWSHVAIVLTREMFQVYFNGQVVCATTFGTQDQFAAQILAAGPRKFGFGPYQGNTGILRIRDFRVFFDALPPPVLAKIAEKIDDTTRTSALTRGGPAASVKCRVAAGEVQVYENNILKLNRTIVRNGDATVPLVGPRDTSRLSFEAQQVPGKSVEFTVSNIVVAERVGAVSAPKFCPGTGNFYAFIPAAGITHSAAVQQAYEQKFNEMRGKLASIESAEEAECITRLTTCQQAWIGGENIRGTWMHTSEAQAETVVSYTNWAPGYPQSDSNKKYAVLHPGSNCLSTTGVELGLLGNCMDNCGDNVGFVVEFETPPDNLIELATTANGFQVAMTSSIADSLSDTSKQTQMRENLLLDSPIEISWNGDTEQYFRFASSSSTQSIILTTNVPVSNVHRFAISLDIDTYTPGDCIHVDYASTSESTSWIAAGVIGTCGDDLDIISSEPSIFLSSGATVGKVRFQFQHHANGEVTAIRVKRLHVQRVIPYLASILVNGHVVSDELPAVSNMLDTSLGGLNILSMNTTSGIILERAQFSLDDVASASQFSAFIDDIPDGATVALSSAYTPPTSKLLLSEQFASIRAYNMPPRTPIERSGTGVYQQLQGGTWRDMQNMCLAQGATLCDSSLVCRKPYRDYPSGVPFFGWNKDRLAYVAVADAPNAWLSIGRAFPRDKLCKFYSEVEGTEATDNVMRVSDDNYAMCCSNNAKANTNKWTIIREGIRDYTNAANTNFWPPFWEIYRSTLRIRGYAWGNPDTPNVQDKSWSSERPTSGTVVHRLGGDHVFFDEPRAFSWTDYTVTSDIYIYSYAMGVTFWVQDLNNYYRYIIDTASSRGYHAIVRVKNGQASVPLAYISAQSVEEHPAPRQHAMFNVTVEGSIIYASVNGRLILTANASGPDDWNFGSAGVYAWMGYTSAIDLFEVRQVSRARERILNLALGKLGIKSALGLLRGDPFTAVVRKGATPGIYEPQTQYSSDGETAVSGSIFSCLSQTMTMAATSTLSSTTNVPLTTRIVRPAGGFTVFSTSTGSLASNANTSQNIAGRPFSIDRFTGQISVNDLVAFRQPKTDEFRLKVAARRPLYDSGYFKCGSQAGSLSFREITHDLRISPLQLRARVLVRVVDGPAVGYEFEGSGCTFSSDGAWYHQYGGIHFGTSRNKIRLWAPTSFTRSPGGSIVNFPSGWGASRNSEGVLVDSVIHQVSHMAECKVLVEQETMPDFDSGWIQMSAYQGSASFANVLHGLGQLPDRVRVLVKALDNSNRDFIFEAVGSAQADGRYSHINQFGAVVFAYDMHVVRIWGPNGAQGTSDLLRTGDGWGNGIYGTRNAVAELRVLAWSVRRNPNFETSFPMSANALSFKRLQGYLDKAPGRIQVRASPQGTSLSDHVFDMHGQHPQTSGIYASMAYGGVVFATQNNNTFLMAPSHNPQNSNNPAKLLAIRTYWANNKYSIMADIGIVQFRAWNVSHDDAADESEVIIRILPVETPPIVTTRTYYVEENTINGTVIGSIDLSGCSDANDDCTLRIVSGNLYEAFSVNPAGEIIVARQEILNYEFLRDRLLAQGDSIDTADQPVIAVGVETRRRGLMSFAMPYFYIVDVNDRPVIEQNVYREIKENVKVTSKVGEPIIASDEDQSQTLTFSFLSSVPAEDFVINGCDGQIRVAKPLAYLRHSNYTLKVLVQDDGVPSLNATTIVQVVIIPVNQPPVFEPQTVLLPENMEVGEISSSFVYAYDIYNDPLTYTIITGDNYDQFNVVNDTGHFVIRRAGFLNFEQQALNTFLLFMSVGDGVFVSTAGVTIQVYDQNDPPVLRAGQVLSVPEYSTNGTFLGTVSASDEDKGDALTFSFLQTFPVGLQNAFSVDTNTGEVVVAPTVTYELDWDVAPVIKLLINVTDNGGTFGNFTFPRKSDVANVSVRIEEVNTAPYWLSVTTLNESLPFFVYENSAPETVIGVLPFWDKYDARRSPEDRNMGLGIDAGNVGVFSTTPAMKFLPATDNFTAILVVANDVFDFETKRVYNITTFVTDNRDPPLSATQVIQIHVLDVQDPSRFDCDPLRDVRWSFWEGYGVDTISGLADDLVFKLLEGTDLSVLPLSNATDLCREACKQQESCGAFSYFGPHFSDTNKRGTCFGRSAQYDRVGFREDAATLKSMFGGVKRDVCSSYNVSEHASAGTVVGTFNTVDDDRDVMELKFYDGGVEPNLQPAHDAFYVQLQNSHSDEYNRLVYTWAIKVMDPKKLNHELRALYWLDLVVRDSTGTNKTVLAHALVELDPENDPPEWLTSESRQRSIVESAPAGTLIGRPLRFFDWENDTVSVSITGNNNDGWFAVNSSSGQLVSLVQMPSLTQSLSLSINVTITDELGASTTSPITITVVNDNQPPAWTNPSSRTIPENSAVGTQIGSTLIGHDPDPFQDRGLDFEIIECLQDRNGVPYFAFSSAPDGNQYEAILVVNSPYLNFEARRTHTIQISITDHPENEPDAISVMYTVQIDLSDIDEPPATMPVSVSVLENTVPGTILTDNISWYEPEKQLVSVNIHDGDKMNIFELIRVEPVMRGIPMNTDGNPVVLDGDYDAVRSPPGNVIRQPTDFGFVIKLKDTAANDALNYEGPYPIHILNISVSDGTNTVYNTVTIRVMDVPEAPVMHDKEFYVDELDTGALPNTIVGAMSATDEDFNTTLYYSISSNFRDRAGQEVFAISASGLAASPPHGELFVIRNAIIDYEDRREMTLTITVRDSSVAAQALSATATVTIFVRDTNDVSVTRVRQLSGDSNIAADELATAGGQQILIEGLNFGPTKELRQRDSSLDLPIPFVSYGGTHGRKYNASNCYVADTLSQLGNTHIICDTSEGVGRDHKVFVQISPTAYVLDLSTGTLSYSPPEITRLINGAQDMATAGGDGFVLGGKNFGPGKNVDPDGAVRVWYEKVGLTPLYEATNCIVLTPHTAIQCVSAAGVGRSHTFYVQVASQQSAGVELNSYYTRPTISNIVIEGPSQMIATDGSSLVRVLGDNFGPLGSPANASYGPSGIEYGVSCSVQVAHAELLCTTVRGIGYEMVWFVNVAGETSTDHSVDRISYTFPHFDVEHSAFSGAGVQNSSTEGGDVIFVKGFNFGPVSSELPAKIYVEYGLYYGLIKPEIIGANVSSPSGPFVSMEGTVRSSTYLPSLSDVASTFRFRAQDCYIGSDDREMRCTTSVGTGKSHAAFLAIRVCAEHSSGGNESMHTNCTVATMHGQIYLSAINYHPPILGDAYIDVPVSEDPSSPTAGGATLALLGAHLGNDASVISDVIGVLLQAASNETRPIAFDAETCIIARPHAEIRCNTTPGAGTGLRWSLEIDGQRSIASSYGYKPPAIIRVSGIGAVNASTEGGDIFEIHGVNLGISKDLDWVRYSSISSALEYTAADCVHIVDHTLIQCKMAPGVGTGLEVKVSIGGQTSLSGSVAEAYLTSANSGIPMDPDTGEKVKFLPPIVTYARPHVTSFETIGDLPVAGHTTEGGVRMILRGRNFGPPGSSAITVTFGRFGMCQQGGGVQFGTDFGCANILDASNTEIILSTPPGQGTDRLVTVDVGGQIANSVFYSYNPPVLSKLVQLDRDQSQSSSLTQLVLSGQNFGVVGTVEVMSLETGETVSIVDIPGWSMYSHTRIQVALASTNGKVLVRTGGQVSNTRVFDQLDPQILDVKYFEGTTGSGEETHTIPVGATAGGFIVQLTAKNLGYYRPDNNEPEVVTMIGDIMCQMHPLKGTGDPRTSSFQVDPTVYTLLGDSIVNGSVNCTAAPGPGGDATIQLVAKDGNTTRESTRQGVPFTYLPPSDVAFVDQGVTTTHIQGVMSGDSITIEGENLGFIAQVFALIVDPDEPSHILQRYACNTTMVREHYELNVEVPPLQGYHIEIEVVVQGQNNTPPSLYMSYQRPFALIMVDQSEAKSTEGGTNFAVYGTGFGASPVYGGVTLGWVEVGDKIANCSTWNDTMIQCETPASQGKNLAVVVVANGQRSTSPASSSLSSPIYSYDPPQINYNLSLGAFACETSGFIQWSRIVQDVDSSDKLKIAYQTLLGESDLSHITLNESVPALLEIVGQNFGLEGSVNIGTTDDIVRYVIPSSRTLYWSHTNIVVQIPPGSGHEKPITVSTGFQNSDGASASSRTFSYDEPIISAIYPNSVPTDGCHKWEAFSLSNRGTNISTDLPLRMCCQPALITISGANFDTSIHRKAVQIFLNNIRVSVDCSELAHQRSNTLASGCDSGYCEQPTDGASCRYDTFPVETDPTYCDCPVPAGACILEHTHTQIRIRPPSGFGINASLEIVVNGQNSSLETYNYDPPEPQIVYDSPFDAEGASLRIEGKNFGSFQGQGDLAGGNVTVIFNNGSSSCNDVRWLVDSRGTIAAGLPYLSCTAERQLVGPKYVEVDVGGMIGVTAPETGLFVAQCEFGFYGQENEWCLKCPEGARCEGQLQEPYSVPGWWKQLLQTPNNVCPKERQDRDACPHFIPCEPLDACTGNNTCGTGYTGVRCSQCMKGKYYRLDGECVQCPDQAWILIVLGLTAAIVLSGAAYYLNKKSINTGAVAIMVDYAQVVALFARSKIAWPPLILTVFRVLSAFNLNIELTAPECSLPNLAYDTKWMAIMGLPLGALTVFFCLHVVFYIYKRLILGRKKNLNRHVATLISTSMTMMYFLYLYLTRTIFDVFNCQPTTPPDGEPHGYLQVVFVPCYEPGGLHLRLLPLAVAALCIYSLGYPILIATILWKNRTILQVDQLLRAMGTGEDRWTNPHAYSLRKRYKRLYYNFRPSCFFWILMIIARKFLLALTSLMLQKNAAFQFSIALLVLFVSYTAHVSTRPYMSPAEMPEVLKEHTKAVLRKEKTALVIEQYLQESKQNLARRDKAKRNQTGQLNASKQAEAKKKKLHQELIEKGPSLLHNYNTVEAILLGCAVFICLSGIMFQSGRFEDETFAAQRDALTVLVMLTIVISMTYAACVLITAATSGKAFLWLCKHSGTKQISRNDLERNKNVMEVAANPLLRNSNSETSDWPTTSPSPEVWELFKMQIMQLQKRVGDLEKAASHVEKRRNDHRQSLLQTMAPAKQRVSALKKRGKIKKKSFGQHRDTGFVATKTNDMRRLSDVRQASMWALRERKEDARSRRRSTFQPQQAMQDTKENLKEEKS